VQNVSHVRRLALSLLLVLAGGIGACPVVRSAEERGRLTQAVERPSDLCARSQPPSSLSGAGVIAVQNGLVLMNLVSGPVTLGIRTVGQLLQLGFTATLTFALAGAQSGSTKFALFGLLTHGVLEIASFVLAGATGLGLTLLAIRSVRLRALPSWMMIKPFMLEFRTAVALMVVAAFIEEFVTPPAIRWSLGCHF
jgi:uncharacterized membrane protein SpoIIM required for sporulation